MNEEPTKDLSSRSFEERVFARFDAMDARFDATDARFDATDARLERLEARSYDTKPIWEQALKEIMETRSELGEVKTRMGTLENEVASLRSEIGGIKTELVDMRHELMRKVVRRFDLFLKIREVDQRDFREAEQRLALLESKFA